MRPAYPFSNGDGLCSVLRGPELWAAVIAAADYQDIRRAIKRADKRLCHQRMARVQDNSYIGTACVRLLATCRGRTELDRHLFLNNWFDIALTEYLRKNHREIFADSASSLLEVKSGPDARLQELSSFLGRMHPDVGDRKPVALLGCALAGGKPANAERIASMLIDHDNAFLPLLADQSRKDAEMSSTAIVDLPVNAEDAEQEPQADSDRSPGRLADSPSATEERASAPLDLSDNETSWEASVSIDRWRQLTARLVSRAESEVAALRRLDDLVKTVEATAAEAAKLPWWMEPFSVETVALRPGATGKAERARLTAEGHELSRLLKAHGRLDALRTRLRQPVHPWVRTAGAKVRDLALRLEERGDQLAARLEELGTVVARAMTLLDEIAVADEESAAHVVTEMASQTLSDLARVLFDPSLEMEQSCSRRQTLAKPEIASMMLALLWTKDETAAVDLADIIPSFPGNADAALRDLAWFEWLNLGQLQVLATESPRLAPSIAIAVFAVAMQRDRPELLEYIEPLLDRPILDAPARNFFEVLIHLRHRGALSTLVAELQSAASAGERATAGRQLAELHRTKVLEAIDQPPGMKKTFHRLRVIAQMQFLRPLRPAIERDDPAEAWKAWRAFGEIDDMVEACISNLQARDKPEPRHYQQTAEYLGTFEEILDRWVRVSVGSSKAKATPELVNAIATLRLASPHSLIVRALLEIMRFEALPIPHGFGERIDSGGVVRMSPDLDEGLIKPTHLSSWCRATKGTVMLAELLSDRLREALVPGGITVNDAVDRFLYRGRFDAARRAAAIYPALDERVESAITQQRRLMEEQFSDVIAQATRWRSADSNISDYLAQSEMFVAAGEFDEARAALELLRECMDQFRDRNDPERAELLQFLTEAGHRIEVKVPIEQLRTDVERYRSEAMERRAHIVALKEAASHLKAAEPVKQTWEDSARRIDRPALWPSAETSGLLAEAVDVVGAKLRGKWIRRIGEEDASTVVVCRAAEWLSTEVESTVRAEDVAARDRVIELAQRLEDGCGDAALLQFLGATATRAGASFAGLERHEAIRQDNMRTQSEGAVSAPGPPTNLLKDLIDSEIPLEPADIARLQKAFRIGDWRQAQGLVAQLLHSANPAYSESRESLVAAYACARLLEMPDESEVPTWLADACIAVASPKRSSSYWIGERKAQEIVPRAILRALPRVEGIQPEASVGERLGRALDAVTNLPPEAPDFLWLADLFRRADSIAPRIAKQLWDVFTGIARNDRYRSALLRFLFRTRQQEALQSLAAEAPDRVRALIRTALRAFFTAETHPEARASALQLSAALREQSRGIANTKPWILLYHSIEAARDTEETASVTVEPDSIYVFAEPSGHYSVEVRVKPSLFAPPESLKLTVGSATPVLLCDDALFNERTVRVSLARDIEFSENGECVVPWALQGRTTLGQTIEVNGNWRLQRSKVEKPIDVELLEYYWPGAKCEPVQREEGFFGRSRELTLIESYLNASPRPRSVMVFGERRIGKTSLLKTLLSMMWPGRARVCGVFCDVSGLRPPVQGESLASLFFQRLLVALSTEDDNGALIRALESHQGHPVSPKELARDIDPSLSLFSALSMLAKRLDEATGGTMPRLALLIDEFDRFAAPLLAQDRAQVDSFMWELREVVQRSERVALILAGSGIQRLLKENYTDALYGSIVEVSLPRFQWPAERDAILDTFAPREIREQLSGQGDFSRVAAYAAQLCGGHPMFLALLGSTAAALANGRPVTQGLLDRVVDRLVSGENPVQTSLKVERKTFYESVFQPLDILPRSEYALARGLLVSLAEHTLSDARFASMSVARLLEVSGLLEFAGTRQLLQALDRLAKTEAIINDKARVRIAVPLTAAALRQDALLLREDIIQMLRESKPS